MGIWTKLADITLVAQRSVRALSLSTCGTRPPVFLIWTKLADITLVAIAEVALRVFSAGRALGSAFFPGEHPTIGTWTNASHDHRGRGMIGTSKIVGDARLITQGVTTDGKRRKRPHAHPTNTQSHFVDVRLGVRLFDGKHSRVYMFPGNLHQGTLPSKANVTSVVGFHEACGAFTSSLGRTNIAYTTLAPLALIFGPTTTDTPELAVVFSPGEPLVAHEAQPGSVVVFAAHG